MTHRLARSSDSGVLVGFIDVALLLALVGVVVAMETIPFINRPPKDVADRRAPSEPIAFFLEDQWPDGFPHDIDTWVECDSEIDGVRTNRLTVGYPRRSALWLDLQRDDLGAPSVRNIEIIQSNSEVTKVPPNTFCRLNVHLYHSHGGILPVHGTMRVILNKDSSTTEKVVVETKYELRRPGEEITVAQLVWDKDGEVIEEATVLWPTVKTEFIATRK